MPKQETGQKNINSRVEEADIQAAKAKENYYTELTNALTGTTSKNLMCPWCGYIKPKTIRNDARPYVVVVWRCPCNRINHTKVATNKPLHLEED